MIYRQLCNNEKIVDYWVVVEPYSKNLILSVKSFLDKGWELYGPPFDNGGFLCQVLVKIDICS